jgi:phage tail-like protein
VSDAGPGPVGAAYRVSKPVPALFHEDPLFLELCAAFDDLLGPFVLALDCFPAYLDPWLAPADFLGWLGGLVGTGPDWQRPPSSPSQPGDEQDPRWRAAIAGAVRGYRARGTAEGLRAAAAAAAGVPEKQVSLAEGGTVTWADTVGAAVSPAFDPTVEITVKVPAGSEAAATAAMVRDAVEPGLPVFSQLRVKVEES